jgi:large subunit ribosomal protein L29
MPLKAKDLRDLRNKDVEDVEQQLVSKRRELMELRFSKATGALENAAKIGEVKRDVARILTVVNERRRAASAAAE